MGALLGSRGWGQGQRTLGLERGMPPKKAGSFPHHLKPTCGWGVPFPLGQPSPVVPQFSPSWVGVHVQSTAEEPRIRPPTLM